MPQVLLHLTPVAPTCILGAPRKGEGGCVWLIQSVHMVLMLADGLMQPFNEQPLTAPCLLTTAGEQRITRNGSVSVPAVVLLGCRYGYLEP